MPVGFFKEDGAKMPKYEIAIYNKQVREKIENGEHHARFTDDWADFHYFEISALNEDGARALIKERHPSDQGFVIDSVVEMKESNFE
jgi:hypothetical protein